MTLRLGLTGSIGMGKSVTAAMFRARGVPVFNADDTVHALYAGAAAPLVEAAFPGTVRDGIVDRELLAARVIGDPEALSRLEAIVHPLVRRAEEDFIADAENRGLPIVVLEIPLLFEKRGERRVDKVIVVSADPEIQRKRVLERPDMSVAKLEALLARQMPDQEKRRRADFVIDTGHGFAPAERQVEEILQALATSRH